LTKSCQVSCRSLQWQSRIFLRTQMPFHPHCTCILAVSVTFGTDATVQTDREFSDNRATASHASCTACSERISTHPSHLNCPTGVKFGIRNLHVMLPNTASQVYKRLILLLGVKYAYARVYRDILEVKNASVYVTKYSTCSHIANSAPPQQPCRHRAEPPV
jgi:hypothetical protein